MILAQELSQLPSRYGQIVMVLVEVGPMLLLMLIQLELSFLQLYQHLLPSQQRPELYLLLPIPIQMRDSITLKSQGP